MSKIDTVTINSQRSWVDIDSKNVKEISICNSGGTIVKFDFALGPNTLANQGASDTGAVYYLKDIQIPVNSTLLLDEQWLANTFSSGMVLYTNVVNAGTLTKTLMSNPTFLVRTSDDNENDSVDIIILRR